MRDDSIYLRLVGHVDNQCNRRRGFAESEMIKGEFLFFFLSFYKWNGENAMLGTKTTRKWRVLGSLFSVIHKAGTRSGLTLVGALFARFSSISGPWTRFRVIAVCILPWKRFPWENNKVWSALMRDYINEGGEEFCCWMKTKWVTSFKKSFNFSWTGQSFLQFQPVIFEITFRNFEIIVRRISLLQFCRKTQGVSKRVVL